MTDIDWRSRAEAAEARVRELEIGLRPAARDVLAERQRQTDAEGWTAEHDDEHAFGELADAAACYAAYGASALPTLWPFDREWWKPTNRRRNLVKAGALIIAEIERLDRAALTAALENKDG